MRPCALLPAGSSDMASGGYRPALGVDQYLATEVAKAAGAELARPAHAPRRGQYVRVGGAHVGRHLRADPAPVQLEPPRQLRQRLPELRDLSRGAGWRRERTEGV